jgi:DNA-binding SARP family transcriptional activator
MLQEIERLLAESEIMEVGGDTENAMHRLHRAVEEARRLHDSKLLAQAQIRIAKILTATGKLGEARQYAEEALAGEQCGQLTVDAYIVLGTAAAFSGQLNTAEDYYQRAANLSRDIAYKLGLGNVLESLAMRIYLPRGQFDIALVTIEQAAELKRECGEVSWAQPFTRAYTYRILGDRQRMRRALDELLPMVKPATPLAGLYYYLWAGLALDEEEFEKASEYLRLALRIGNHSGAPDLNILVRIEYSRYYRLTGDAPVARTWAEDGTRFARRSNLPFYTGIALIELALACWEAGDLETTETILLEAREILTACGGAYDLARAIFLMAAFHDKQKKSQSSKTWLEACDHILNGGFVFILERKRTLAFPLVASHLRSRNARARSAAENLLQHLSRVSPPPLRINGLGQFVIWQSRRRIPDQSWNRRKAGELTRFLLLKPNHSAGREEVLDGLWPDSSPSTAMAQFHQATSTLRHILEPDLPDKFPSRYLTVEGERVFLNLPPGSVVDFEQFEQVLPPAMRSMDVDDLEQALSLYTGELFPMDRYSDWSASRRESIEELYQRGLLALGLAYFQQQQYFESLECARKILARDSWNEDAVLLGMQSYVNLRDYPRALRMYLDLETTLSKELSLKPRADLRTLAHELRQGK